ncbi:hypothetical protein ACM01_05380 [Streptomyces viridochromogenes]|uniref:Uncharacterized protein n=2 Tax=Streptomyces viridochromogenes TaxID=1938 RepID=A0A0J7ZL22_STRVR|nr:hypothetical protein ACM01_05380 [Streptomyces viridochromogenes]KOG23167.1 hypothetical protein ADK35_14055 [Streptomyces viridochromogenes]KOG27014.1 hypothetical protein ADK36_00010 [Streptomyces viridochromogenes]
MDDWEAITIPEGHEKDVREIQSLARGGLRKFEIAATQAENGEMETANEYLESGGETGLDAVTKARAEGFKVCPGGY